MKDGIIKGTGNSRYLKSSIPEGTTWEQALAMLISGKFPIDLNGKNTDGWKQIGSALNKANLLPDDVVIALGLEPANNPQVKNGFEKLAEIYKYWWKRRTIIELGWKINISDTLERLSLKCYPMFSSGVDYADIRYVSEISASGTVSFPDDYSAISYSSSNEPSESTVNVLRNKYVQTNDDNYNEIYYIPQDAEYRAYPDPLNKTQTIKDIEAYKVLGSEYVDKRSDWEYLSSYDINAYPKETTKNIDYVFLGKPFENSRESGKIESGLYIGTGTSGKENPNSLTFNIRPKVLIITARNNLSIMCPTSSSLFVLQAGGQTSHGVVIWSNENKTVSWYATGQDNAHGGNSDVSASYQLNINNQIYHYIGLGY